MNSMTSLQPAVRWGILGTGDVAARFAAGLRSVPDARLLAVGSRTRTKAEAFAGRFAVPRAYGTYEDLVGDKEIDVVYVATPNFKHKEDSLLALAAGKAVLCEKPFAICAAEAREVVAAARRLRLFCMEAMWSRFLPAMARLRRLLDSRVIGEIRLLRAEFGSAKPFAEESRFFRREIGGGALLNLGVYLVSFASSVLGRPCSASAQASFGSTGVDEQAVAVLGYPGGALATLTASIRNDLPCQALLVGTRGEIRIHPPLYRPERISVALFEGAPPPSPAQPHWLGHHVPMVGVALVRKARAKFGAFLTGCLAIAPVRTSTASKATGSITRRPRLCAACGPAKWRVR